MSSSSNVSEVGVLTKRRVLELLSELFDGFANEEFQQQLHELEIKNAERGQDLRCVEGRQALALAVQQHILPRYGFSGDESGVLAMKMAVRKHMGDPRVARKSMDIRDKLLVPELPVAKANVKPSVAQQAAEQATAVLPIGDPNISEPKAPDAAVLEQPAKTCVKDEKLEDLEMEVIVQHAKGHGQLIVCVPYGDPTMSRLKEAIVAKLGHGMVSDVQLVLWGGGMFVNHRDCDPVMTDRVFSTGLDLRSVN